MKRPMTHANKTMEIKTTKVLLKLICFMASRSSNNNDNNKK